MFYDSYFYGGILTISEKKKERQKCFENLQKRNLIGFHTINYSFYFTIGNLVKQCNVQKKKKTHKKNKKIPK